MTERTEIDEHREALLRLEANRHLQAWKEILADYHKQMEDESRRHALRLADIHCGRLDDTEIESGGLEK